VIVASTIDCKYVEESDLAASYLAGRLSQSEAEAFERHYLACERCRSELQTLSELRAALGRPAVLPVKLAPVRFPTWRLLATAAVVAATGLGLWQLTHRSPEASVRPVLRGGAADALAVTAETLPDGRIKVSWPPNQSAQVYVVHIIRSDGVTAFTRETRETRVTLDRDVVAPRPPSVSFVAKVEALDPTGQVIARGVTNELFK
jgi:anti-sigma factor RsiW